MHVVARVLPIQMLSLTILSQSLTNFCIMLAPILNLQHVGQAK